MAPAAEQQAELFVNLDITFGALREVARPYIQDSITGGVPALDAAIRSFPIQRPFLRNTELLFRELLFQFVLLLVLTALSVNVFIFVAIPLLFATVCRRFLFLAQIWKQYGYSRIVLALFASLSIILSIWAAPVTMFLT